MTHKVSLIKAVYLTGLQYTSLSEWMEYLVSAPSQEVLAVRNLPANAGDAKDVGLIPGS